ncbi:hypothetical protein BZG82_13710 [Salinivibrio sp. PR5]|nr:hypothetical protein BZG82_13710 [Salinivibrio sp. PR5]
MIECVQRNRFTDYGLRTLIFLASLPEGELTNITEVIRLFDVSCNHMVKAKQAFLEEFDACTIDALINDNRELMILLTRP